MGPDDSLPATNFSNISAGANARQHNGNVINRMARCLLEREAPLLTPHGRLRQLLLSPPATVR